MVKGFVRKSFVVAALMILDLLGIIFSFILAYYIRSWLLADMIHIFPPMEHGIDVYLKMWSILSFWLLIFAYEGLYPSIGKGFWEETKGILKGNTLTFLILILLTFITKTSIEFSRPVIMLSFLLSVILVPFMRFLTRSVLRRAGLWMKEVLIVGSTDAVSQVLCNLKKHPDWGLKPVGAVLQDGKQTVLSGIPVVGNLEHMEDVRINAQEVIVAMPHLSREKLLEVVESASRISPVVKMLPDLYGIASVGVKTYDLDGMLLLEMEDRLALKRNAVTKRVFDILCSFMGLVLLSPLFFLLAALIKLDSKGPVFFGHKRLGKGGRYFSCYKFRTMLPNAQEVLLNLLEHDPGARAQWESDFKLKDDPRITRIGSFLRKTSLDELPQLLNVLKGDMSLVGPRPIVADEVEKYGDKSRYLFKVPPGITGLWQVSGRNDVDYDERILLDEYYAKNWSLWLDIEVVMRTFGAIVKKEGAY
ncbi:MAG: undecaprenyl-phosphate galactose phosphotransferase WbaP [Deltaproteobacteria bacterium]|nr:undecaprenyl-phosphate galactose phosphotransferase WbaP [Deltaproteobacteria bacterium]